MIPPVFAVRRDCWPVVDRGHSDPLRRKMDRWVSRSSLGSSGVAIPSNRVVVKQGRPSSHACGD
jgi:hypothetical protein